MNAVTVIIHGYDGRETLSSRDARAWLAGQPVPPAPWSIAEQVEALRAESGSAGRPALDRAWRRGGVLPRVVERLDPLLACLPPAGAARGLSRAELCAALGWSESMVAEVLTHGVRGGHILRRRTGPQDPAGCVTYRRPAAADRRPA